MRSTMLYLQLVQLQEFREGCIFCILLVASIFCQVLFVNFQSVQKVGRFFVHCSMVRTSKNQILKMSVVLECL